MTASRVILLRHGRTEWNLTGRFQGSLDVPLDEVGRAQADRAGRLLAALRPAAIVSSDLSRARDTAAPLRALTGLAVRVDPRVRERHYGEWEGLPTDDVRSRFPTEFAAWDPPGAETYEQVAERVVPAVRDAVDTTADGGVLVVVSHGGAIRTGVAVLLGLSARPRVLGPMSNCCWSVLSVAGSGWRLLEYNAGTLPEPVLGDER
ncbi:MAG: histidine phosphatase family protein [Mycobacteriales bacterium]